MLKRTINHLALFRKRKANYSFSFWIYTSCKKNQQITFSGNYKNKALNPSSNQFFQKTIVDLDNRRSKSAILSQWELFFFSYGGTNLDLIYEFVFGLKIDLSNNAETEVRRILSSPILFYPDVWW